MKLNSRKDFFPPNYGSKYFIRPGNDNVKDYVSVNHCELYFWFLRKDTLNLIELKLITRVFWSGIFQIGAHTFFYSKDVSPKFTQMPSKLIL